MARKTHTRPALTVTRDSDGGLTIHDPQSELVVSIIATRPDANGPRGLYVEVYAYRGGPIIRQDVTRGTLGTDDPSNADRHPTTAYYAPEKGGPA